MKYADMTVNDPSRVKRWIQRRRFRDALQVLRDRNSTGSLDVLDFGGGDGELLSQCLAVYPELRASLYEPTAALRRDAELKLRHHKGARIVGDLKALQGRQFDVIFCLEVFEHLPQVETDDALAAIYGLAKPGGHVVIGVPHELFLPALAKGLFRMTRRFGSFDARPLNVARAAIGRPPKARPTKEIAPGFSYYRHHVGFDHRQLERALKRRFEIVSRWFSPARALGQVLNSEVYYLLRRHS